MSDSREKKRLAAAVAILAVVEQVCLLWIFRAADIASRPGRDAHDLASLISPVHLMLLSGILMNLGLAGAFSVCTRHILTDPWTRVTWAGLAMILAPWTTGLLYFLQPLASLPWQIVPLVGLITPYALMTGWLLMANGMIPVVWRLAALLGIVVLGELALFGLHLPSYLVARFHGERADLRGAHLRRVDLSLGKLRAADLQGADLRDASLHIANLQDANLGSARLDSAFIEEANLNGAHLQRAHLQRADLQEAKLTFSDLREADLRRALLDYADLRGATLIGADMRLANLLGADLREATLDHAKLTNACYDGKTRWPPGFDPQKHGALAAEPMADFHGRELAGLQAWGANLSGANLSGANLLGADLGQTTMQKANLKSAVLDRADLFGADLTGAFLQRASLVGADLQSANFTGADLTGANVNAARYNALTTWPSGFDPIEHGAVLAD